MPNPNPVVILDSNRGRPVFGVSNNVSRETFNYVRDNPGMPRKQVVKDLVAKGFKETSVSSLINQLTVSQQITQGAGGVLIANVKEYIPIKAKALKKLRAVKLSAKRAGKTAALVKAREAKAAKAAAVKPVAVKAEPKQKYQPQEAAGIAALSPTTVPLIDLTAEKILDGMGVRQAKVLYAELKKIFEE